MAEPFTHKMRVRYGECDLQGVVFNAHYLAYVDVAITELWRTAFGGYQEMLDRDVDIVVAEAQLRFHASARFDDELTLEATVTHMGITSIVSRHRILRDDELLVECTIRHVFVDRPGADKEGDPRDGRASAWPRSSSRTSWTLCPWLSCLPASSRSGAGTPARCRG